MLDGKRFFSEFLNFSNNLIAVGVSAACLMTIKKKKKEKKVLLKLLLFNRKGK